MNLAPRLLSTLLVLACAASVAHCQQLAQPVYRVPNNPPAAPQHVDPQVMPAAMPVSAPTAMPTGAKRPAGLEDSPLDIYEAPGEHPLMPCIRLATRGLAEIEANIKDYTALLD